MPRTRLRESGPAQRARSEKTRDRVIRAAVDLIADEGLAQATTLRIAARSGVSWGGIQHQFGDKRAVLDAVLEHVLRDFEARTRRFSTRASTLEGRVRAWVDASWELLQDPTYQAFREVMRGARHHSGLDPVQVLAQVEATLEPLREGLFPGHSAATLDLMNTFLFATLSGIAEQERYAAVRPEMTRDQLAVLRDTLSRLARERGRS